MTYSYYHYIRVMRMIFNFISSLVKGLGAFIGSIIFFLVYGLIGYFFFWVLTMFSAFFIEWKWITNEYVIEGIKYLFVEYKHINEVVFAGGFGLLGVLKYLQPSRHSA